jgi:hypothetical protein
MEFTVCTDANFFDHEPDLSATIYWVELNKQWPAKANLSVRLTDPGGGGEVQLYALRESPWHYSLLGVGRTSVLIENANTLAQSDTTLLVMVSNGRAVSPYADRTPIRLIVEAQSPPTFLPTLRLANYVHVGIEVPLCSAGSQTCPKTLGITNWFEITPQAPNLPFTPANWTDNFRITGKASTAANDERVDISVEFDDTGNVLKRLDAAYSWTCREGSLHVTVHKMNFTIEGLPHTYPAKPGTSTYQKFSSARRVSSTLRHLA